MRGGAGLPGEPAKPPGPLGSNGLSRRPAARIDRQALRSLL
jgi:hypothetical protein